MPIRLERALQDRELADEAIQQRQPIEESITIMKSVA